MKTCFNCKRKMGNESFNSFLKLSCTCEANMFGLQLLRGSWFKCVAKSLDLNGFSAAAVMAIYIFPLNPVEVIQLQSLINI